MHKIIGLIVLSINHFGFCADWVITSLDDSGSGTLREALENVEFGQSIEFSSSLSGTILLASSLPPITTQYLVINGPTDNSITIDGDSSYKIFDIQAGPFTINHLQLNNGADSNQGGAIHVNTGGVYAYVSDVTLSPAAGAYGENCLFADDSSVLSLTDVVFSSLDAPQVYLNTSTLNITSNIPLQFVIDGIGGGQVNKYGDSSTVIITPPFVTSDYFLTVINGLVVFNGALQDPCVISNYGTLIANGHFSEIANLGILEPGDASTFGEVDLTGNYFTLFGETHIKLDPNSNVDLIHTDAVCYIYNSILTLLPESGTYTQGSKYTFFTADDVITGTFSSVNFGGLDAQINYHLDSIEIEILNTTTIN